MLTRISALLCVALALRVSALDAAEFTILPLRVDLDRTNRAAEIVIRNDDTAPLRLQLEAMSWQQDAEGRDHYEPGEGLTYFPRALEIPAGESRIVRLGVRAAPVSREEAFRLFFEQLPPPTEEPAPSGARLRVLLRVGVPVFVAPLQPERKGEIAGLQMQGGRVRWVVANAGNVHFVADRAELVALGRDGSPLYSQQIPERYFLAGVVKTLQADIPRELCAKTAALEVSLVGEQVDLRRRVDVEPGACN
jgi:fimbrial chaperone protein